MLSIYQKNITEKLCDEYCKGYIDDNDEIKGMLFWVKNRIQNELVDKVNAYKVINRKYLKEINEIQNLLTDNKISEILIGNPIQLLALWDNQFKKYASTELSYIYTYKGKKITKTVKLLYHLFNYDSFRSCEDKSQYRGYLLSKRLGIECCPYCNRNYTTTHSTINGKKVFPEFDHFYHKSSYPLLAISFYNLIPSCNICNTHYKGKKDVITENLLHPYEEVFSNHFSFKFIPDSIKSLYGKGDTFQIEFDYNLTNTEINNKVESTINFFGIKETYESCHNELIKEIINKKMTYSNSYLNIIEKTFGISFEESYRILFETYYEDDKLHQRPFSKLKKDIFDDINIK
jgi:hypothetical protein